MQGDRFDNDDPQARWNHPRYQNDQREPHNDPRYREDPFAPWNRPTATERETDDYYRKHQ